MLLGAPEESADQKWSEDATAQMERASRKRRKSLIVHLPDQTEKLEGRGDTSPHGPAPSSQPHQKITRPRPEPILGCDVHRRAAGRFCKGQN
jgi:hypothetical protein